MAKGRHNTLADMVGGDAADVTADPRRCSDHDKLRPAIGNDENRHRRDRIAANVAAQADREYIQKAPERGA